VDNDLLYKAYREGFTTASDWTIHSYSEKRFRETFDRWFSEQTVNQSESAEEDEKTSPTIKEPEYDKLWKYMFENHGVELLTSDMDEIVGMCKEILIQEYAEAQTPKYTLRNLDTGEPVKIVRTNDEED
jgi:hypothetical protein